jgi:hypothetical protein
LLTTVNRDGNSTGHVQTLIPQVFERDERSFEHSGELR